MPYFEKSLLETWCANILERAGAEPEHALHTARIMMRTDARGIRTHGITRLASYVDKLGSGDVSSRPNIIVSKRDAVIDIDADGALGQVAMMHALAAGLQRLEEVGIAMVIVRECGHLGALGLYALQAAEAGAFCMLAQRTPPLLALEKFRAPAVGNNPIAFASPVAGAAPLVFDMACSVAARGHILVKSRKKEALPEGWALNSAGEPTLDADAALAGSLLPSAGYKGLGIAMLVECLAGGFSATPRSISSLSDPTPVAKSGAMGRQNAFMLLIKPSIATEHFDGYMAEWAAQYHDRGGPEARLPGERGAMLEKRVDETGLIDMDDALFGELRSLQERMNIMLPAAVSMEGFGITPE